MSKVGVSCVDDIGIDAALSAALESSDCASLMEPGHRVLVKPNWNGCGVPGSTSIAVVLAVCRWAMNQGASQVVVGEGPVPIGRAAVESCFESMGVHRALEEIGATFINFDDAPSEIFTNLKDLPLKIGIAKPVYECDLLINVPLLKVHSCCLTTLSLKNLKGCLRPDDKMAFHHTGLLPAIVALNRLIPSCINIVDAIDAMEGDHNRGPVVHLGYLLSSTDRVALDTVASELIGLKRDEIPLLKLAAEADIGSLYDIEIIGMLPKPRKFELPQDHLHRMYQDLAIVDDGACSACRAALMDGLYAAGASREYTIVAAGKSSYPPDGALVMGNCLRQYRQTHSYVPGCPPDGAAIARALKGQV